MAIVTLKKAKVPNILFGIVLNNLESNLYHAISNKKLANEVLKDSLNIYPIRFINIVEVVNSDEQVLDLLVIYDMILTEREEMKIISNLKVENFNFNIFNFNRKEEINIEAMISPFNF